jgi:hypothetical protein
MITTISSLNRQNKKHPQHVRRCLRVETPVYPFDVSISWISREVQAWNV